MVHLGELDDRPGLGQQVADLAFQVRRLEANIHNLEQHLEEALNAISILQQPKDVRYVRERLRGRS